MSSMTLLLMLLLGGDVQPELLAHATTAGYWQSRQVKVTADEMTTRLRIKEGGDVQPLLTQLGNQRPKVREEAQKAIIEMGPGVIEQVRPLTKSEDKEVAARATEIVEQLNKCGQAPMVDRLMAIRTLGEIQYKPALAELEKLAKSKEPFVAQYALRATAAINGKAPPAIQTPTAKDTEADLYMLPSSCSAVGQMKFAGERAFDFPKLFDQLPKPNPKVSYAGSTQRLESLLTELAIRVGNFRIDAVTMGVAGDMGDKTGYVVLVGRGTYNAAAVRQALLDSLGNHEAKTIDGVEVLQPKAAADETRSRSDGPALILPSNERIILLAGPSLDAMPIKELAAAVKGGKGTLAENKSLGGLLAKADMTGPIWGAIVPSESYKKEKLFAPFDSILISSSCRRGETTISATAKGADGTKVKEVVDYANDQIEKARLAMAPMGAAMPMVKPLAEILGSLKAESSSETATATASFKSESITDTAIGQTLLMIMAQMAPRQPVGPPTDVGGPPGP